MPFTFRPPVPDDAEMLLAWRTDPVVTRFMYTDITDPSEEKQRAWLTAMEGREDFRHFVIEHDGEAVGYLSFSDIDRRHKRCSTGSYMGTPQARRMLAGYLHAFIHDYAYYVLGMHKVVEYFLAGNDNVVKIQRILKLREVGLLKEHVWKDGRFHDVHVFELLESDWRTHPRPFTLAQTLAAFGLSLNDASPPSREEEGL
ncbi:MAG TPA: GNAT family N-acetyltransferase [Azospirillaceae bacterium]|nr:GNAT family N-acetyltransferase [Azospirillaceae bacterium]HRQ81631.1 GNAT family N-acetyltransferase [Azospirillaceae bacterium]